MHLRNDEKKMYKVSAHVPRRKWLSQRPEREYLLCERCENQFSKYETYASRILIDHNLTSVIAPSGNGWIYYVEYKKFKLFLMSLLWRASVSTLLGFTNADIGPFEPHLKAMLLAEDPGFPSSFGCVVVRPKLPSLFGNGLTTCFGTIVEGGIYFTRFVFFGLEWIFVATDQPLDMESRRLFLQEDGALFITTDKIGAGNAIMTQLTNAYRFEAEKHVS